MTSPCSAPAASLHGVGANALEAAHPLAEAGAGSDGQEGANGFRDGQCAEKLYREESGCVVLQRKNLHFQPLVIRAEEARVIAEVVELFGGWCGSKSVWSIASRWAGRARDGKSGGRRLVVLLEQIDCMIPAAWLRRLRSRTFSIGRCQGWTSALRSSCLRMRSLASRRWIWSTGPRPTVGFAAGKSAEGDACSPTLPSRCEWTGPRSHARPWNRRFARGTGSISTCRTLTTSLRCSRGQLMVVHRPLGNSCT